VNRIHRLIWSDIFNGWIAVAENTRARGKRTCGALALLCVTLEFSASAIAAPPDPGRLPTGGQVVAGQAAITQSGARMDVNQSSQRGIINWDTFNVGAQGQVNFNQPNAGAVTLNRVLDSNPSQIFGRITANGQVFLTNPNGVYFSPSSSVDVGGLVATTHSITDTDFMAGKNSFSRNGATGSVINEGNIKAALGGYIALLAPEVRNNGVIVAQLGTAVLASGESITLNFDSNSTLVGITVTPSQISALVENRQAVLAPGGIIILSALAANSLQGGVINNSGRLEANGLSMKGGKIVLEASTRVENSGLISASAGNGVVTAEGTILQGGPAGSITINAPGINNSGVITATGATASLPKGGGHIRLDADNIVQTASGRLDASSGTTSVTGSISLNASQDIALSGSVTARASSEDLAGTPALSDTVSDVNISIKAGHKIALENTVLDASGSDGGGSVHIEGGQYPPNLPPDDQPTVFFLGNTVVSVGSRRRNGGNVTVIGQDIGLLDGTRIDASGATGGGTILIGGDAHGANANMQNAQHTFVDSNVHISADATQNGNGGKIVVWADNSTGYKGNISAQGGALSGNGGWVEVSGKQMLAYGGLSNTSAAHGRMGSLLLDPTDITISTAADTVSMTWNGGAFSYTDTVTTPSNLNTTTLQNQLALTNVTVDTTSGLGGFGDITVSNPVTWVTPSSLTLLAARNIVVNAAITGSSAPIALTAPTGTININAAITGGPNVSVVTTGLTMTGGSISAGGGGSISINSDSLTMDIASTLQAPGGILSIAPFTPATSIGISGGAGTLALTAANFATNFVAGFSDIIVGDPGTGAITVGGPTTANDNLTLMSGAAIAVNAALSVPNTLTLASATSVSGGGDISAANLWLNGGAPGVNFILNTAVANNVGTLAADNAGTVSFLNSAPLIIGSVGPANGITAIGTVSIETLAGNLTVAQNITTTDTTAAAVSLNAGKSSAAGTAAGGDIVIAGGAISTGAGGTATLMTGSVAGSTGVAAAAGAGNYRYNSDELATNYTTALGPTGTFAIYREQPIVTVTANADTKSYDGLAYATGNGVTYGGFANGETSAVLGGAVVYGGSAIGAVNAGSYLITPSGLIDGLGYALNYVNGALTVNAAALTVTADSTTKTYGTTHTFTGTEFTSSGLVNGETIGSVSLSSAGAASTASVAGGPYAIVPSAATGGTFNASNYNITYGNGTLTVSGAPLIVVTANSISKMYGVTLVFTGTEFTASGLQNGDTIGSVSLSSAGAVATASVAGGPYAIVPSAATGGTFDPNNYTISYVNGVLTVIPAPLTITANGVSKTYDGLTFTGGNGVLYNGFVNGETNTVLGGALTYGGTSQNAINAGSYAISPGGLSSTNYQLNYVDGTLTVNKAALSVTANDASKSDDGTAYTGGNGVTYGGFVNGETAAVLGGLLSYGGTSQGAINAGKYIITPNGLTSGNYSVSFVDGVLTINLTPAVTPPPETLPPVVLPPPPPPIPNTSPIPSNVLTAGSEVMATDTKTDTTGADATGKQSSSEPDAGAPTTGSEKVVADDGSKTAVQGTNTPAEVLPVGGIAGKEGPSGGSTTGLATPRKENENADKKVAIKEKNRAAIKTGAGNSKTAAVAKNEPAAKAEPATQPPPPAIAKIPVKAQDFLPGSRVQAAVDAGLNPGQAERAGNAYSATVVRELSKGAPMDEAMARADQVFKVVASLPPPSMPQEAAIKNLSAMENSSGANPGNQITALDTLTGTRVQAAISTGLSPVQAERAGNAYSAAVVKQLSKGASMDDAIAHAEQVFKVVANFPAPSSPEVAALKNLAAGGNSNSTASQLTAVADTKTAAGSVAFNNVVTSNLAKGVSMAQAIQAAQTAVRQVDAMANADHSPQSALASGKDGSGQLANRSAGFQKALGEMMAKGYSPEKGMQRATQIAEGEAAAIRADAKNPAVSLASGKLAALPDSTASGNSDKGIAAALARGLPIGEALVRAQQIEAAEQRAVEADARNPTAVFSNGNAVSAAAPATNSAEFDRAVSRAIARGETPDKALASAQLATARISAVKPTTASALASGENVDSMLISPGSSRTYRTVLGNALARGIPVEKAIALAKIAEEKNAFHTRLPDSVPQKITLAAGNLSITTANGKPLPAWLRFSPESREFIANEVPDGALPMQVVMHIGSQNYVVDISEGAVVR